jgi:hypothetical protein
MPKVIEKLTPAQEAMLEEVRQQWIEIGLCTNPADRPKAEAAILESYRLAGLAPPKKIGWCGSPLSQGLTRAIVLDKAQLASVGDSVGDSIRDSVKASVWDSVGESVWGSVWDSVGESVWGSVWDSVVASVGDSVWATVGDSVKASVWDSVWDSVGDSVKASVWDSVWATVRNSVRESVWDSVWASVGDSIRASVGASVGASVWDSVKASVRGAVQDSVYGQHEAAWLSFYDFFRKLGLIQETDKIQGLAQLAKNSGWILPHEHLCWVSERHNVLMRDNAGRIHNLAGPAIAYPDGWAIYAVHGVRVPADWIEHSNNLDVKTALTWSNIEQRRAAAEILGWERVLNALSPSVVDEDRDPMIGTLLRVDLPDAPRSQFLKVRCGTGRNFVIAVPEHVTTALEANAWTYGLDASDYKLEVRT